MKHLLKEGGGDQSLVDQLPTLGPGQFQLVSPDVDPEPIPLQCRWLYTDHGAPLSEEQVEAKYSGSKLASLAILNKDIFKLLRVSTATFPC